MYDAEWLIRPHRRLRIRAARSPATGGCRRAPDRRRRCGTCSAFCCCWRWPTRSSSRSRPGQTISYSEFKSLVREGQVQEVTVAEDRIRGQLKQAPEKGTATSRPSAIEDPEAGRGAREVRRQVHRRGRQPLGGRGPRLGHSARLPRRALELLLPPDGRRRRRRHVVRAQPRQDLRRRRRQGEVRRRRRRGRGRGRAARDRRVPEEPRRSTRASADASPRACCWSGRRAPARRCWRAPSPAKRRSRSSA